MTNFRRFIGVKTSFAGVHHWVHVPKNQTNSFLQFPHRHRFNLDLMFKVDHVDRQIEYFEAEIEIQAVISKLYGPDLIKDLGNRSCELIGTEIYSNLSKRYQEAVIQIKVQEDDEGYAVIQPKI